jgi:hypothetical protein
MLREVIPRIAAGRSGARLQSPVPAGVFPFAASAARAYSAGTASIVHPFTIRSQNAAAGSEGGWYG